MASLTGSSIKNTYKSLLKLNDETNGIDTTLEVVEDGEGTDSCLYLSTKQLKIKSATDIDAAFEVQNSSGESLLLIDTASSPEEVVINEGGLTTVDFRVESDGEDEALLVDASANTIDINKGKTAFTTKINSYDGTGFEGLRVDSSGVVMNQGGYSGCDFRVESSGEDYAIWLDSSANTLYVNHGETAFTTEIHNVDGEAISVSATEVIINNDGIGTVDFRAESLNEDEALFLDASADTLYINKGENAFTTSIHSTNDVAITVNASGVIFNEDSHATNDFRVESDGQTHMFFVDSGANRIGIGTDSPDQFVDITTTGTQLQLSYDETNATAFWTNSSGDLSVTPSGGDITLVATTSIDLKSPQIDIGEDDASDVTINLLGSTNDMAILYDESAKLLKFDSTVLAIDGANDKVGIGVVDPDHTLEVLSTGTQLKLSYDSNSFSTMVVDGSSNLTIATGESGIITLSDATTFTAASTFSAGFTVPENQKIYFDSTDTYIYANTDSDEDLVIGADDNIILEPDGNVVLSAGNVELTDGNLVITAADHGIIHTNSGTVTQGTNATTAVTLNTTSGVITTYAATLATNTEVEFTLTNSTIQADSIVLVTMQDENTDANSHILTTTNTIAGGSCKINLFNCGSGTASATACKIHFLVINNS